MSGLHCSRHTHTCLVYLKGCLFAFVAAYRAVKRLAFTICWPRKEYIMWARWMCEVYELLFIFIISHRGLWCYQCVTMMRIWARCNIWFEAMHQTACADKQTLQLLLRVIAKQRPSTYISLPTLVLNSVPIGQVFVLLWRRICGKTIAHTFCIWPHACHSHESRGKLKAIIFPVNQHWEPLFLWV